MLFSSKRAKDVLDGSKFADAGWDRRAPHWVSDRDKRTTTARGVLKRHVHEGELLYDTGLGYTRVRWTPVPVKLGEHAFLAEIGHAPVLAALGAGRRRCTGCLSRRPTRIRQ